MPVKTKNIPVKVTVQLCKYILHGLNLKIKKHFLLVLHFTLELVEGLRVCLKRLGDILQSLKFLNFEFFNGKVLFCAF